MQKSLFFLVTSLLLAGCGSDSSVSGFLGSYTENTGGVVGCAEFGVTGNVTDAQRAQATNAMRVRPGFSTDRCNRAGVIGTCNLRGTSRGVTVQILVFMPGGAGRTIEQLRTACTANGGSFSSL